MPGPRVLCYLLWHCPLPCTAWCAKPDPDPDSPGRCGLAGCRLQSAAPCVSRAIRSRIVRPIRRAGPRPEGMRTLSQAPPNVCAVLPHLVAAPPGPGNRNQNQGPSRPREGSSLVVCNFILQAASASAVDVNRVPRPACGASGGVHPKAPPDLPQVPGRPHGYGIQLNAPHRLAFKQRRRHLPKANLILKSGVRWALNLD